MLHRQPYNPGPHDDDWEDQPTQGWFYKWVLGVVLPAAVLAYGLTAAIFGRVTFGGRMTMTLVGTNAVAFGLAWCSAAVFVHCHYFWGNLYDQWWPAVLGKIVSATGFILGLGYVLVRNGVFGIQQ